MTATFVIFHAAEQSRFDFLEGYNSTGTDAVRALQASSGIAKKTTKASYSTFLVLNSDTLSSVQRVSLMHLINERFADFYSIAADLEQRSFQLLPPETFGSLASAPAPIVVATNALPKKVKFLADNPKMTLAKAVVSLLQGAGIEVETRGFGGDTTLPDGKSPSREFDVLLSGQGTNTDYPEIEFHLNMVSQYAWIKASNEEKQLILDALHSNDRKRRHEIAQTIGSAVLADARIVPLVVRSYVHLYRKDRVNIDHITNYDGDIPFWKMQVKPQ